MPDFELTATNFTVADYCASIKRGEIRVNREYQRSGKVWPAAAQSFLIETILLEYPIPKLSLHQKTDLHSRMSVKEIIDGQQRTRAIVNFYENRLKLSRTTELEGVAGKSYEGLSDELKQTFLDYPISVDLFTGALPEQIREVFRRINSYTVPLNPEEQRHATFQGEMKWFIYELCRDFDEYMLEIGTFSEGRLVRMADAKLYAEIVHALVYGVQTTKRQHLDRIYEDFDIKFEERDVFSRRFRRAMDAIVELHDLHNGPLMKPHMMYSLLLALMHYFAPIETLREIVPNARGQENLNTEVAVPELTSLASVLDTDEPSLRFAPFVAASESKTNVKQQRGMRIQWLYGALLGEAGI